MGIGERLKMARALAGLNQRELASRAGVSAMAISKYERNLMTPGSDVLLMLARALNVKAEFLLRPRSVTFSALSFRKRYSLPARQAKVIVAQAQDWLERYLEIEAIVGDELRFEMPENVNRNVSSLNDAERLAVDLREAWELGIDPIDNLIEIVESRGIKVGIVDGHDDFDALTELTNKDTPVIIVKRGIPGDRQRFSLCHELAHLIMEPRGEIDIEKAANRFAGAFLVPQSVVRAELGHRRRSIHPEELCLLKHKHGLSMMAWIHRARDAGVISESAHKSLMIEYRKRGWHRAEPGRQLPAEEPGRLKRLVLRLQAEGVVSPMRAAELSNSRGGGEYRQEEKENDPLLAAVCP